MQVKSLLKGIGSYVPGLCHAFSKGTGGTDCARYCYSIWLRHLVMADAHGLPTNPETIAELGPGDSLGTGLAALLSGAKRYYGLDVVEYANPGRNFQVLEELVPLFEKREDIPDHDEFPMVRPRLENYAFPDHILSDGRLAEALRPERIAAVKKALLNMGQGSQDGIEISYFVPWNDSAVRQDESVDMIFTQGVMHLVDNLEDVYAALSKWMKPGGYMSHEIDFTCYRVAREWNGYWAYSSLYWKLLKGKRQCIVSREPHSAHIRLMEKYGFKIICDRTVGDTDGIGREGLHRDFAHLSDDDLRTSGSFIQAQMEGTGSGEARRATLSS